MTMARGTAVKAASRGARALYLTIDQGGHASRVLVFDTHGCCITHAETPVVVMHHGADRVEMDAEALLAGIRDGIARVADALGDRLDDVVAAALVTQRSSVMCWDRVTGAALTPVLSWQDRRARTWLRDFGSAADRVHATTGLRLSAHYGASKLRWCLDHVPAVQAALHDERLACGPLAGFLLFRLLAECPLLIDHGNAARTLLWNLQRADWDAELSALFGVPIELLPRCVPNVHAFGTLVVADRRIPMRLCHGDQPAALFATGSPRSDTVYINVGTGAFVQRILTHNPGEVAGLLTALVLDDGDQRLYALEGTVNGAGSALDWLCRESGLRQDALMVQLPDWLDRPEVPALFLNGISGLGAPFWVADFASRFIGDGDHAARAVAVVESIVFLLQSNLETIDRYAAPAARIVISGGLSRIDGLCQRIATLSGRPVKRATQSEATARGTAWLLAAEPAEWDRDDEGAEFTPRQDALLHDRYTRWRVALDEQLA